MVYSKPLYQPYLQEQISVEGVIGLLSLSRYIFCTTVRFILRGKVFDGLIIALVFANIYSDYIYALYMLAILLRYYTPGYYTRGWEQQNFNFKKILGKPSLYRKRSKENHPIWPPYTNRHHHSYCY